MATIKIIVRAEKMRKNGEVPLYIRMTSAGKSKYISLRQTIPPKAWDADRERVRKSYPNSARLNAFIAEKKAEVSALALDVEQGRKKVGRKGMRDALADGSGESFLDHCEEFLKQLERQGRMGTLRNYRNALNCFRKWLREAKKKDDLPFNQLTHDIGREYKSYLEIDLGNGPNTVVTKFAALKSGLSAARDAGIVEQSFQPLTGMKMRLPKTKKMIPTREEMAKFEMVELEQGSLIWHTRNLYLFCANMAGIRFGDAVSLRWANVVGDRLQWQTRKTSKQRLVYIPEAAREILNHYRKGNKSPIDPIAIGYVFPFLEGKESLAPAQLHSPINIVNTNCNTRLKKIWRKSGCMKEYSFHTSRHFFATDSLRRGMRVEVLQHLLTHSSLDQTMQYAQIANEDMDAAMRAYEVAKNA